MPRPTGRVKAKSKSKAVQRRQKPKGRAQGPSPTTRLLGVTVAPIDLHFHGAFGIDLMAAGDRDHDALSEQLWLTGLGGYCATTLSAPPEQLHEAVRRLGQYIRRGKFPGAWPLGIHLEGPFINPNASGAHTPGVLRKASLTELETLWDASQGTLKILTLAPETLPTPEMMKLSRWCADRAIVISLGHSKATESEATQAFEAGWSGVTHAWNALNFHHREPGALGAALGRKGIHVELIIDGIHVAPTVIRWVLALHSEGTCFVSDCAPAAATRSGWHSFGDLQTEFRDGACRLPGGALAGGGLLLPDAYRRWLGQEAAQGSGLKALWKQTVRHLTQEPLKALKLPESATREFSRKRRVAWKLDHSGLVSAAPER